MTKFFKAHEMIYNLSEFRKIFIYNFMRNISKTIGNQILKFDAR